MLGEIPWSTKSGEEVEKLIAVYICKENPDAVRIRPSKGDHGIDLMNPSNPSKSVDVYQIKKFATNLGYSQKKQIKDSWNALIAYVKETGLNLRHWYLVMPLNPTTENISEICQLTQGSGIDFSLIGLDTINGWAAKYPEVQDYFLNGEQDTIYERAARLVKLNPQAAASNSKNLYEQLVPIRNYLNDRDPNYRYFVKMLTKAETEKQQKQPSPPPEALFTTYYLSPQGESTQIDVVPKYKAAPELAPCQFKANLMPANDQQRSDLFDFIDFGTPIKNLPATIIKLPLQALDTPGTAPGQLSTISLYPVPQKNSKLDDQYLQVEGEKPFIFHGSITGRGRKGFTWNGTDDSKILELILKVGSTGIGNKQIQINITFSLQLKKAKGAAIGLVQKAIDFLAQFYLKGRLTILDNNETKLISSTFPKKPKEGKRLLSFSNMLLDLKECEEAANQFIPCPDLIDLDANEAKSWHRAAELLRHKWIKSEWTQLVYTPFEKGERIDMPKGCIIRQSLKIVCDLKIYPLGFYVTYMNIGSAQTRDDAVILKPPPEEEWLINRLIQSADRREIGMIRLGPVLQEKLIEAYLKEQ